MHKRNPRTFEATTLAELAAVTVGMHVKVCAGTERFWIKLIDANGEILKGIIDNDLVRSHEHGLKYGELVSVERRHIYQIYSQE